MASLIITIPARMAKAKIPYGCKERGISELLVAGSRFLLPYTIHLTPYTN
jgi:hypothetical protein